MRIEIFFHTNDGPKGTGIYEVEESVAQQMAKDFEDWLVISRKPVGTYPAKHVFTNGVLEPTILSIKFSEVVAIG
jgi:hypothetical protein